VVLVFMQLGFRGSVENTATLIYRDLQYDLVIRSTRYLHLGNSETFRRDRLDVASELEEIASVEPLLITSAQWREVGAQTQPDDPPEAAPYSTVLLLGVDPYGEPFSDPETAGQLSELTVPGSLLIDRQSKAGFGPLRSPGWPQPPQFGDDDIGRRTEVNGQTVEIRGHFEMGAGFGGEGAAVVSERQFYDLVAYANRSRVNLGLVTLTDGTDPVLAKERLTRWLRSHEMRDVEVLTRAEVASREEKRWLEETPIGVIFFVAVVFAIVVAVVIVYQVLASDVANREKEYATMKAIGFRNSALATVVIMQATMFAVGGFLVGWLIASGLYEMTRTLQRLPIWMTPERVAGVFGLAVGICLLSALATVRKLAAAAPADLF